MSSPPGNESVDSFEMTRQPVSPISVAADGENEPPESTSVTSTDTPKPEDGRDVTQAVSDRPQDKGEENTEQSKSPIDAECPLEKHVLYSLIMIVGVGVAALASACWLVADVQTKTGKHYIKADVIGGTFSSTIAKLIDAACSMLVAPAVVAITNRHMFKLARLSAVNEHRGRN
ncbi:hypothetical protein NW762_014519 [Fusarium torreyae]|uniref:Uncharacterized protein n=1 Tax=Fusarium torreyae TaxID=1237075 RepID=A0A9W8V6Q2_9HYPO|nr:hypothetical protein NW762_014519 [Fusarium torreyae]